MLRSWVRLVGAVVLAVPGLGLALVAKPFVLGERVLLLGLLGAFACPILWLICIHPVKAEKAQPGEELDRG